MAEDLKRVKEFWQEYRAAVLRQGVAQAKAEWFVRWAQRFARAVPGVSLRDLESQTHVEAWQVDRPRKRCACCISTACRGHGPSPGPCTRTPRRPPGYYPGAKLFATSPN